MDKININGIEYKIEYEKDLHEHDNEWRKKFLLGHIVWQDRIIKINSDVEKDMQKIILIHESIHAMFYQSGIADENEDMIRMLGYGVYALIKNNPELVKAIIDNG